MSHASTKTDANPTKTCRTMSIFATTKKCYPQSEISIYIIIRIKISIKIAAKKIFILIRIIIRIIMNIKISIRTIMNIIIRIKINIKIRLDTMIRICYYNITRNIIIRIEMMRDGGKTMARPKLDSSIKKTKLSLTISPDAQEMLDFIRRENNVSISEFVEDAVRREYKRLRRAGRVPDEQIPGQITIGRD